GCRSRGIRRPRARLVRRRARRVGRAVRPRAPRRSLRPEPRGRARRRRSLLAKAAALPPDLLPAAPAGGRAPLDAARRTRTLARVAARSRAPSPAALPPLLRARPPYPVP